MGVRDRLERIEKELSSLPKGRRRVFLCWEAARAGLPLDTEASFDALLSRIETFESGTVSRFLSELETDLEVVRELRG
jgi:hypothetical protein